MLKTLFINIFWIAALFTGCGMDSLFDSPKSAIAILAALVVAIFSCIMVLALDDDN